MTGRGRPGYTVVLLLAIGLGTMGRSLAQSAPAAKDAPTADIAQRAEIPLQKIAGVPASVPSKTAHSLSESADIQQLYDDAKRLFEAGQPDAGFKKLDPLLKDGGYYEVEQLAAEANLARENLSEAEVAAKRALELRPDAIDTHFLLAVIQLQNGDAESAIAHFRQATLASEKEIDNAHVTLAWLALGEALARSGYLLAAVQAYEHFDRDIWEINPERRNQEQIASFLKQNPLGALTQRLELLGRLGRKDAVLKALDQARERWPNDPGLRRLLLNAYLEAGKIDPAFALIEPVLGEKNFGGLPIDLVAATAQTAARTAAVVKAQAESPDTLCQLATIWNTSKDYDSARQAAEAALRKRADNADATRAVALSQLGRNDAAGALDTLAKFTRAYPQRAVWDFRSFQAAVQSESVRGAVGEKISNARTGEHADFATHYVLGLLEAARGDTKAAEDDLHAASDVQPDFVGAVLVLADLKLTAEDWNGAKDLLKPAIAAHAESAELQYAYAQALDGLDENEAAEKAYRAAIRMNSSRSEYMAALAKHDLRLGEYVGAVRYFQQAAELAPNDDSIIEGLFDAGLRGGKDELVQTVFQSACNNSSLSAEAMRRMRTTMRFAQAAFSNPHIAELKAQFEAHPLDVRTGLLLAGGLFAWDRLDEAQAVIAQVRKATPTDEHATILLANIWLKSADFDRAADLLEALLKRFPNRETALQLYVQAALYSFRTDAARHTLERLLATHPDKELEMKGALLRSYTQLGDYDGAMRLVEGWTSAGKNPDALESIKISLLCAGDHADAALRLADERLNTQPNSPDRRSDYVIAARKAKAFEAAEAKLQGWLKADPQKLDWLQDLLSIYVDTGRKDEALDLIEKCRLPGDNPVVARKNLRTLVLIQLKRYDDAIAEIDALLRTPGIQPQLESELRRRLVLAQCDQGSFDAALKRCDAWISSAGENAVFLADALQLKYSVLSAAERMDEAAKVAEKLLESDKRDPGLNNDLAYTWADSGQHLDRTPAMVKLAVASDPLNAMYLDSLGWVYYKTGDARAALIQLERAVQLEKGRDGVIFDHLGDARWQAGQKDGAVAAWKRALERLPEQLKDRPNVRYEAMLKTVAAKVAAAESGQAPAVAPTAKPGESH